ncbi:IDEAL domain-containing protein [Lysinibacillus sp. FSL R7-0073]|uniref:IDEAL domain protein n=1 Tax=Lysinibacillus fusiformis TaxID=28031 RepID=A0A1E4R351_9BACI|nr:IDEAL domain-containing protein [Lysinibacillus fusiformis]HBJ01385.1 IDEAL domain-containing protein [Lysinibacillus sp.]MBD8519648.1 IDEAL domain-containing protein [Lysinibacillus fusiformis]MCR8851229.1 IDEAL domain-containing protein [Lysinibacillus fusiformis]MED4888182.1 IDEAL domain-containing protein [Lysinibacillus fusiformis]ODV54885.1 IDEAL domain protein [Lysinibacillus fusiformis]
MDKYYSYTDFLKAVGQSKKVDEAEKLLNEIYLDLFLNRIQRMHRQEQLIVLIDRALDEKDENAFYQYATELNSLQQTEDESY